MKYCAWCNAEFKPGHNARTYCSVACRELATREKIAAAQTLKKRRRRLKMTRKCAGGCGTSLSIYNDSKMCAKCIVNKKSFGAFLNDLRSLHGDNS